MTWLSEGSKSRSAPAIVFGLLFIAYHLIFHRFLSGEPGSTIGHDYSFFLPAYLDGYYWFLNNGPFAAPWFTAAFCGGLPVFADPQSTFYSPAQWLVFFTDPLTAVYLNLLASVAAGYWGMYVFCRRRLACDVGPAALAGALWMFNGFATHRYLVGHVTVLPMLLVPVLACLLLPGKDAGRLALAGRAGLAALVIAAAVHAGFGVLLIPFALSVWALACLAGLRGWPLGRFYVLAAAAAVLATGIAAAKLAAVGELMASFPRSHYRMPGIADPLALLLSVAQLLFGQEADFFRELSRRFVNRDVGMPPHELAFGLTLVPVLLIVPAAIVGLRRRLACRRLPDRRTLSHLLALAAILACPLALLYYSPGWNDWLKTLPLIASIASPWRWLVILLAPLCAATALALPQLAPAHAGRRGLLALAAIALLVGLKAVEPRDYYRQQPYDPKPVVQAYRAAEQPGFRPAIRLVGGYTDPSGKRVLTKHENDPIVSGVSQAYCYNPLFGYWLENYPIGPLHGGDPLAAGDGILNLKNPACYVFPAENGCRPGEHFHDAPEDRARAERLLAYRPWPFVKSDRQRIAESVTAGSLIVTVLLLAAGLAGRFRRGRRD